MTLGPFGDRVGRRRMLIVCVSTFAVASLIAADTHNVSQLTLWRFVTGFGVGGAMPNAITLTSEYCPSPRRSILVRTMFCGFTIGSALGGFAAAALMEHFGWRSVLLMGGVLPLVLLPVIVFILPESVRFLTVSGRREERVAQLLQRIDPSADLSGCGFTVRHIVATDSPVRRLFRADLLRGTLLFWVCYFMGLGVINLLTSWLPTLLRSTGLSMSSAAAVTAMYQLGAGCGAIVLGWLMDRINPHYVLTTSYTSAALFIFLIGNLSGAPLFAGIAVFGAGFCVSGSGVGINALSAAFYPTDCRASGVSWANGIGRLGSARYRARSPAARCSGSA